MKDRDEVDDCERAITAWKRKRENALRAVREAEALVDSFTALINAEEKYVRDLRRWYGSAGAYVDKPQRTL